MAHGNIVNAVPPFPSLLTPIQETGINCGLIEQKRKLSKEYHILQGFSGQARVMINSSYLKPQRKHSLPILIISGTVSGPDQEV